VDRVRTKHITGFEIVWTTIP